MPAYHTSILTRYWRRCGFHFCRQIACISTQSMLFCSGVNSMFIGYIESNRWHFQHTAVRVMHSVRKMQQIFFLSTRESLLVFFTRSIPMKRSIAKCPVENWMENLSKIATESSKIRNERLYVCNPLNIKIDMMFNDLNLTVAHSGLWWNVVHESVL